MFFLCPLCSQTSLIRDPVGSRFCDFCCVFPEDVINARPLHRAFMARFCRELALDKPSPFSLAQARTWEKAARRDNVS